MTSVNEYFVESRKHPERETGIYSVLSPQSELIWEGIGLSGRDNAYSISIVLDFHEDPRDQYKRLGTEHPHVAFVKKLAVDAALMLQKEMRWHVFPDSIKNAVDALLEAES